MSGPWFGNCRSKAARPSQDSLSQRRSTRRRRLPAVVAALALGAPAAVLAQSGDSSGKSSGGSSVGESDFGAIGRIGHLGFETFGRTSSITPIEVFPYVVDEENFFFGDMRGFVSNHGNFGGNFGLGYRYLNEGMLSWYGGSLWYDIDDTTGLLFHQIGLSFDAAIENWELRSNLYLPVGDTEKSYGSENFAARFVGNQVLFDSTTRYGSAMKGVDVEAGYNLPLDLLGYENQLRVFAGGYFFDGDDVDNITGVKVRGELVVNNAVTTQVAWTNDDTFGSNVMVGMTFDFPFGSAHPTSRWGRAMPSPYRPVERNYNVIVSQHYSDVQSVVAINPRTGLPYEVQHVSSTGGAGGNGSATSSWATVAQAQAAGADVIYVHSNTVLSEQISLIGGQQLLGEIAGQSLVDQKYGSILLPNSAGGTGPRISGVTGNAVTLGSNSIFSGFTLDDITGNGIVSNGVSDVVLRNLQFSDISGDAVQLNDSTGSMSLSGLNFQSMPGRGLVIDGGTANYTVSGQFQNVGGDAVTVANMTAGTVLLQGLQITDGGGRGLVASNLTADLTVEGITVKNSTGDSIVVDGGDGNVAFTGITTIDGSKARGLVLSNLDSEIVDVDNLIVTSSAAADAVSITNTSGDVIIDNLTLALTNGRGLFANDVDDLFIKTGTITTTNAAGVDIEDSNVTTQLKSVSVDNGAYGIRIVDTTGSFAVAGGTSILKNLDTAIFLENAGTVVFQTFGLKDNDIGVSSRNTQYLVMDRMEVVGTTHYALDSMNDRLLSISNSVFTGNGALNEGTLRIRADAFGTYQSQILNSTISDKNGTAIEYSSLPTANGATLGVLMQGTKITGERGGKSLLQVNWNGPAGLTLDTNQFIAAQDNMTVVDIATTSATDRLTLTATTNAITLNGASGRAFNIDAASTSTLQLGGNGISMNGGNGTGFRFQLQDKANVTMTSNYLIDNAFGGTGVLFEEIAAGSAVEFGNNRFDFMSTGMLVDQGIIFNNVGETVQLSSNRNNAINGATTNVTLPSGKTTGKLRINGANYP